MTVVHLDLGSDVSVVVDSGVEKACAYTIYSGSEEIVSYETSADVRAPAGLMSLRNIVYRRVDGVEKATIEARLEAAVDRHADAIDEVLDD